MQGRQQLAELLDVVVNERNKLPHLPPLLVKIAPDLTQQDKEDIAAVITREKVLLNPPITIHDITDRAELMDSSLATLQYLVLVPYKILVKQKQVDLAESH